MDCCGIFGIVTIVLVVSVSLIVLGGPIKDPILLNTHGRFRHGLGVPPLSGQRHTVCLFL